MSNAESQYADIINLPHHVSKKRAQMNLIDRAASFAPFAALTGYDDAVKETARLTDTKLELDENTKEILNDKLQIVLEMNSDDLPVSITYFVPDKKKTGGAYVVKTGTIKRYDEYERQIIFTDKSSVSIDDVIDIECEVLKAYNLTW